MVLIGLGTGPCQWSGPLGVAGLRWEFDLGRACEGSKPMPKCRAHSIEFKRQVAQEYLAGETRHGLATRHDIRRNLIRVWVAKYEAGAFDDDATAADVIQA